MDEQQFKQWLLGVYRPEIEQPKDEIGGFLIPHYITSNKVGKLAAMYRWVGRLLRNQRIYEKGTYQFDMYAALTERKKK